MAESSAGSNARASSKVMSMKEAIARYVKDGDTVYMAGFTHLIPFAAGHEIIRQKKRDLVLCRATPDLIYDQMIAAGCARKVVFSWAGNPGVGLLRAFRAAVEAEQVEIEEYSHFGLVARLAAGASNIPFMPLRTHVGSDLPRVNPNIKTVKCPYTGEEIPVVPALRPDVAVVHVQRCDAEGNSQIWGIIGEQRDAAFAAATVIVSAEEIVDESIIRSDPNRTVIPGFKVDAVVEEPWGAHPSYAQGYYDRDNRFYLEWDSISASPDALKAWLDRWVYGVSNRRQYMELLGREYGAERILALIPGKHYSYPVDYGFYKPI